MDLVVSRVDERDKMSPKRRARGVTLKCLPVKKPPGEK